MTEGHVKMRTLKGIPASGGVAIGKGFFLNRVLPRSVRSTVGRDQVDEEVASFQRAVARSREQILHIRDGVADPSSEHHQILSVHLALLEDSMLIEQTVRTIRDNQFAADWAFNKVLQNLRRRSTGSRIRTFGSVDTTCARSATGYSKISLAAPWIRSPRSVTR